MRSALFVRSTRPVLDGRRGATALAATVLLTLIAGTETAAAGETDQFVTWGVELADSSEQLNLYVNRQFEAELAALGRRRRRGPCEKLPGRLYRKLFKSVLFSPVRGFLRNNPGIDRFPDRGVGYWEFRGQTIFRKVSWPVILPMSRTVRIGDVYLGVDKIGHFFGFGRRYHALYQRARRRGLSPLEAERKVVLFGLRAERFYVGGVTDGIVSHADLEANYQGLRMARDMCEGDDPYLERTADGWRLRRPVDLRVYVNPAFDESYNTNHYHPYRWRLVKPILVEEVCPRLDSHDVRQRLDHYRKIDPGSFSRQVIDERYRRRQDPWPLRHSLAAVCAARAPVAGERMAASHQ